MANTVKGADGKSVPMIFRRYHEFDGGWFGGQTTLHKGGIYFAMVLHCFLFKRQPERA